MADLGKKLKQDTNREVICLYISYESKEDFKSINGTDKLNDNNKVLNLEDFKEGEALNYVRNEDIDYLYLKCTPLNTF